MATVEINLKNTAVGESVPGDWNVESFRCHVAIVQEDEGDYSALALNLPGVAGTGDTMEEAIDDLKGACIAAIESYRKCDKPIPWTDCESEDIPEGSTIKWVIVTP